MKTNIINTFITGFKYRFSLEDDKANEEEIIDGIKKGVVFRGANLWTLIFAILVASIGLNVNSTAVIIGAMLISPLMGPIMGIGLGAGIFDFALIKNAFKNILIATVISLITSTLYFLLTPLHQAQSELLARTSPTIWDVLIAFFGGLAGIVASSRKKFNNVIPGVAIATALMPPLCTAGYGIATAQWSYFLGAFYLYMINGVFISIATFLIVRFLKFKPTIYDNGDLGQKVRRWVWIIAFLTIAPSIYLAYSFVTNEIFKQNATSLIENEMQSHGLTILYKNINPESREINLTILDYDKLDSIKQILEMKKEKYQFSKAKIIIKTAGASDKNDFSINELREGIVENLFKRQEDQLSQLKIRNEQQIKFDEKKKEVVDEFYALYGKPKELIIEKTVLNYEHSSDTVLFIYIKGGVFRASELKNMQVWLKTKFNTKSVKLVKL